MVGRFCPCRSWRRQGGDRREKNGTKASKRAGDKSALFCFGSHVKAPGSVVCAVAPMHITDLLYVTQWCIRAAMDLINRPARRHPPQLKPSVLPSRCSGMHWVWNYSYRRYYFEPEDLGAWTCDGCRFGGDKAQQHMDRATHGKAKRRRSILVLWRLPGDRYTPNRP